MEKDEICAVARCFWQRFFAVRGGWLGVIPNRPASCGRTAPPWMVNRNLWRNLCISLICETKAKVVSAKMVLYGRNNTVVLYGRNPHNIQANAYPSETPMISIDHLYGHSMTLITILRKGNKIKAYFNRETCIAIQHTDAQGNEHKFRLIEHPYSADFYRSLKRLGATWWDGLTASEMATYLDGIL